jgi:hypothetical protein
MILLVAIIALSILVGFLFRGSLRRFENLRLRWWSLAIVGLALQFVPVPDGRAGTDLLVRAAVLSGSYALLVLFALVNLRIAGMPLVLLGLLLNAAVIIPNAGMPVSADAVSRLGKEGALEALEGGTDPKHHLMSEDDVLTPLADQIAVPPLGVIASAGDLFLYAGIAWLVVAVMLGRTPPTPPGELGRYRGKHRQGAGAHAVPAEPSAALSPTRMWEGGP